MHNIACVKPQIVPTVLILFPSPLPGSAALSFFFLFVTVSEIIQKKKNPKNHNMSPRFSLFFSCNSIFSTAGDPPCEEGLFYRNDQN